MGQEFKEGKTGALVWQLDDEEVAPLLFKTFVWEEGKRQQYSFALI